MDSSHKPLVCISLCEQTIAALAQAIASAAEVTDLIEVRLDCLDPPELETGAGAISKLLQNAACQSILTFRPSQAGGRRALDDATREAFWSSAIFSGSFFDVELDLAEKFQAVDASASLPIDWSRTICSHHDFAGLPVKLDQIYERMSRTPARVLKIAVQAQDAIDCLQIFQLLQRAHEDGREIIAIAMGIAGVATRILGPSRGAFLTYASLDRETATAPGQLSVSELHEIYRIEKIDRCTQIFGLVGQPVSHSLSPRMHNAAFAAAGINAVYLPFETGDIKTFIKRLIHPHTRELDWNVHGLSVTAPHKFSILDQLDSIEPAAQAIGAVNTIVIEGNSLHGHNTDASGFIKPLAEAFGDLRDARCAVIGTGGAASAALWSLNAAGAQTTLVAREAAKGNELAARFNIKSTLLPNADFAGFDVVVNATPLGTLGQFEDETPVTASRLRGARLVYDLVYNPTETKFLREARQAGCKTLGGLAMLAAQAAEQFKLWTDEAPGQDVMLRAAERGLEKTR
ncbi:MAG TPA: shikimate dehydrogenase [Pyrinomonadaceae bacterium]|jgi:3-dehydroquinate dehydratase/shikimate dehydrogenase|nr:shikimate dehydrogenase [Pyrinomonadaceae bacterium]